MADNPLRRLTEHGQSVWLDFISRELVTRGGLERLMAEAYVTGLTSNPTIFDKAIAEGTDYDAQLKALVDAGMTSADDLFVEMAVSDIQHAADTLRPVHDRTGGCDGFVSLEVAPALAHDPQGTIDAARFLWGRVERPNLMVKVPATPAGIPAIRTLIAEGVNVNVTLIFALDAYEQVALAYVSGLEDRLDAGKPLDVRSVASFFVSRVDTEADKRIEALLATRPDDEELQSLRGTAAIANARLAYEKFEQIFAHGDRFSQLRRHGASVQRPLWASTSAKSPRYRDVVYAEALIGPDTVDTMPPATIDAFRDHGVVDADTVTSDYPGAHRVMDRLAAAGVDMDDVTRHLLEAGVGSFADSYNDLIQSIARKVERMRGGLAGRVHIELGPLTETVRSAAASDTGADIARRIWGRDPDLWKPGDAHHASVIRNRLGWLDVVGAMRERLPDLLGFAREIREEEVHDAVLLGMGGSSLAPELLRTSFGSAAGHPILHVLDTTDPVAVRSLTDSLDPHRTLFIVSSKSGGTVETLSHMEHFWQMVRRAGIPDPGCAFAVVTDPGTSLGRTARERGFRRVFENPPDIGGRYSALSFFGLVPAAVAGIDVGVLLERAAAMAGQCAAETPAHLNPGLSLGTVMGMLREARRDKVTILAPSGIAAFSLWAEQLIAESTGKEGRGIIPIGAEPVGDPSVYGQDRLFVALRLREDRDFDAATGRLRGAGHPMVTLDLADLYDLGGEFFRWEFATAVAGAHVHIDPFDEPNVQESKDNTNRLLAVFESQGRLPEEPAPAVSDGGVAVFGGEAVPDAGEALCRFLDQAAAGYYVALMAYVTPDAAHEAALQDLRVAIRDSRRVATTLGFGPRFLHSTGQLHKGGPNTGVYVQITADGSTDVEIPGKLYTFGVLKRAQAQGDLESLHNHGRRAIRLHVSGDLPGALRRLAAAVRGSVGARR